MIHNYVFNQVVAMLIYVGSSIRGQNSDQTLALLDSGTTLAFIPTAYAKAIYGDFPASAVNKANGIIAVSCDFKANVSFIFGYVHVQFCSDECFII